jgi:hypothetical protein
MTSFARLSPQLLERAPLSEARRPLSLPDVMDFEFRPDDEPREALFSRPVGLILQAWAGFPLAEHPGQALAVSMALVGPAPGPGAPPLVHSILGAFSTLYDFTAQPFFSQGEAPPLPALASFGMAEEGPPSDPPAIAFDLCFWSSAPLSDDAAERQALVLAWDFRLRVGQAAVASDFWSARGSRPPFDEPPAFFCAPPELVPAFVRRPPAVRTSLWAARWRAEHERHALSEAAQAAPSKTPGESDANLGAHRL